MIVPLAMTIYFSTLHYNLLNPGRSSSSPRELHLFPDRSGVPRVFYNTLLLVGSVLAITIVLGTLIALLLDQR